MWYIHFRITWLVCNPSLMYCSFWLYQTRLGHGRETGRAFFRLFDCLGVRMEIYLGNKSGHNNQLEKQYYGKENTSSSIG